MFNQEELKKKYNCNVRLKSTKDGKIKSIYRNNGFTKEELLNKVSCENVLKNALSHELSCVFVTGFNEDGEHYVAYSNHKFADALTALLNLENRIKGN